LIADEFRDCALRMSPLVLTAALALSACGDKDGDASDRPAVSPTVRADTRLAAMVPDEIKRDAKITVAVDSTSPPMEFLAVDGKTIVGWDRELFDAVAAKLGLRTEWISSKFDDIIPGVESGKYEAGVSSFTISPERMKQVTMVSYFRAGTQWMTKKGNPRRIKSAGACGKKVAVQRATVQVEDLEIRSATCKKAGRPGILIDQYQAQDQVALAVASGKDDAGLGDSPIAASAVQRANGRLELLGNIYQAARYGFVLKKDQPRLAQGVAEATNALMADGTYNRILAKWNVQSGAIKNSTMNP
jgi:polar amino acid transport system substrate-binding protein